MTKPLLYFKNQDEWREWLHQNHTTHSSVELVFYKVSSSLESMRWEEAVKVALCNFRSQRQLMTMFVNYITNVFENNLLKT